MNMGLPDFENPPINEVVVGVQLQPIRGLTAAHMGLFWSEIRDRFPRTEEQGPLTPVLELFGKAASEPPPFSIRAGTKPDPPRVWFLTESGSQLVQLQQDRLHYNWRRTEGEQYPRYSSLRGSFEKEAKHLSDFITREGLGEFKPTQCEVTYTNLIQPAGMWQHQGQLDQVFTVWEAPSGSLPPPEDGHFGVSFVIADDEQAPLGRLRVNVQPGRLRKDDSPIFRMDLTARGRAEGDGLDGVLRFLDRGHEWIVRGFTDLTTPAMHQAWGRIDV